MNEDRKRLWDVRLGIVAPLLTLVTVIVGVWQFNTGEANRRKEEFDNALLKDDIEFRRKLWLERLERYRSVAEFAGRIAALPAGRERDDSVRQFEAAYWGVMILVEDAAVSKAMVGFRQALIDERRGYATADEVKVWADTLMKALRASLEAGSPQTLRESLG